MLPARVETLTFHTEGPINPGTVQMRTQNKGKYGKLVFDKKGRDSSNENATPKKRKESEGEEIDEAAARIEECKLANCRESQYMTGGENFPTDIDVTETLDVFPICIRREGRTIIAFDNG
ncbi:hypothetical protein LXL04_003854 [Taraxacum kok-saghyz]